MSNNINNIPENGIDWDTPYYTDTLTDATDPTPTATTIEGIPGINLSATTWQTSELFIPSDVIEDADIVAYARARRWNVFAITSVEFVDSDGDADPDDEPAGWTIVGK